MQITDKIQDACFVWTQIKNQSYFQIQTSYKKVGKTFKNVNPELCEFNIECESPLLGKLNKKNESSIFNELENIQFK